MPGNKPIRHWMPFYVDDYLRDTLHLSVRQHGIYIFLLLHMWKAGGCLPSKRSFLAKLLRLDYRTTENNLKVLLPFFEEHDGKLTHKRITLELEKANKISNKQSEVAKKRWVKQDAPHDAMVLPENSHGNALTIHIQKKNRSEIVEDLIPPTPQRGNESWREEFDRFWSAYPKKRSKGQAEKAWQKMKPPLEKILHSLSWQIRQSDWLKDGGQFIPYAATYLRAKGWEDAPEQIAHNLSSNSVQMLSSIERLTREEDDE